MQFMQQVKEKLRQDMQGVAIMATPHRCIGPTPVTVVKAVGTNTVIVRPHGYAGHYPINRADLTLKSKRFFLAKGDPDVDCLTWYLVDTLGIGLRIEGYDENRRPSAPHAETGLFESTYGPAMSMSLETARDSACLPNAVRECAAQHLAAPDSGANLAQ